MPPRALLRQKRPGISHQSETACLHHRGTPSFSCGARVGWTSALSCLTPPHSAPQQPLSLRWNMSGAVLQNVRDVKYEYYFLNSFL